MEGTSTVLKPPGYWMHETGGLLAPVIHLYLTDREHLPRAAIGILRAYFRQWIGSDVWDQNPNMGDDGRAELRGLRLAADQIETVADIDRWLARAVAVGVDPL